MILEYLRPKTMDEAVGYLQRPDPKTIPLGGGTRLSRGQPWDCAVVDLQDLGLDQIEPSGNSIRIGAMTRLQDIVDSELVNPELRRAAAREAGRNLRQAMTIGGLEVSGDGYSPLLTALLALDASLIWEPGNRRVSLGEWLPVRDERPGALISAVEVPGTVQFAFECLGRTPVDRPFVCAAVAKWPSGRTRAAIGGGGSEPVLIMDGSEPDGIEAAVENSHSHLVAKGVHPEYQKDVLKTLLRRIVQQELSI